MGMSFTKEQYEKAGVIWASRFSEIVAALGLTFYDDIRTSLRMSASGSDMLSIIDSMNAKSLSTAQEYGLIGLDYIDALRATELAYRCVIRLRNMTDEELYPSDDEWFQPRWIEGMMRGNRSTDSAGLNYTEA